MLEIAISTTDPITDPINGASLGVAHDIKSQQDNKNCYIATAHFCCDVFSTVGIYVTLLNVLL